MKKLYFSLLLAYFFNFTFSQISFTKTQELSNISTDVSVFDKDNDGDIDLYFTRNYSGSNLTSSSNYVWENDGNGNFTNVITITQTSESISSIILDIQNNSYPDIFTLESSNNLSVSLNNSNGSSFSTYQSFDFSTQTPTACAKSDIENDGDDDLLLAGIGSTGLRYVALWYQFNPNYTNYGFITLNSTSADNINAMALSDIDNDGDEDLILSQNANNKIFENNIINAVSGSYDFLQNTESSTTTDVKAGDLDNDGDNDLIFSTNNGNHVWLNDGNGNFTQNTQVIGSSTTNKIALEDINNDGYLDVVFANSGANEIWINTQTNGEFSNSGLSLGTENTKSVAIADVNSDGKKDIIFANWDTNGNDNSELWINNSTLSITESSIKKINIFPNPTTTYFNIESKNQVEKIDIYDILGKKVKSFNQQENYNINHLKKGIYFVNVYSENYLQTFKIIKQ